MDYFAFYFSYGFSDIRYVAVIKENMIYGMEGA